MLQTDIKYKDIVLIGGGHAHAIVVKMWGMRPTPGVRLTLISKDIATPYSGMLPGLVAGHYDIQQTHIDLFKLCSWANVRFVCASVSALNTADKCISLTGRPDINYDILSINTGSTPNIYQTSGAAEFATGVKPVSEFYQKWLQLQQKLQQASQVLNIALVGAGAGGFELIMAMQHAYKKHSLQSDQLAHQFHWIVSGEQVLSGHNKNVQAQALQQCQRAGIKVHFNFLVKQVKTDAIIGENPATGKNHVLAVDEVIWCTAAAAATWPAKAGLALDEQGFFAIEDTLQCCSDPDIFAAGDVATQINSPRPKAGVFAVRQGPVLFKNLSRAILQKPLQQHKPQLKFLSLLACGGQRAIASRGVLCIAGNWVWRWKNKIDRQFMDKFNQLPDKPAMSVKSCDPILLDKPVTFLAQFLNPADSDSEKMRCGGCGAKVGGDILSQTLNKVTTDIPVYQRADIIIGLESPDDAAVISTNGQALAQSVDQFRSIIDDPYLFARIATNHALSDLYAMASQAQSALSIVAMPFAGEDIQKRELYQLMYGVIEELNRAGCTLTGGHTSEALELSLGLAVNGLVNPDTLKTKRGVNVGQQLIITKPIGTGVIMAAHMQAKANGNAVQQCLDTMLSSNGAAANILANFGCTAMTDLTGFGLIGHLLEMLKSSELQCNLSPEKIPVIAGAQQLSDRGFSSSLLEKNIAARRALKDEPRWRELAKYPLLFDPQTSGGLLAWVDIDQA
ncbi:MAG: selenide, water dikinase SelD, partial [Pseudomonadales bacterium]|nr:selenide, water dikinase SelD [Pseudomonadales bacterium]